MSTANAMDRNRLLELLADEAIEGLDGASGQELASLIERTGHPGRDELMQTAALVQVTYLRRDGADRMPASLKARIAAQAEAQLARAGHVPDIATARARRQTADARQPATAPARGINLAALSGWAVAAALAVALVLARPELPASPSAERTALLANASDTVTLPWTPPTAAGYEQVRGDVVWSDARQAGYLRLTGMPVNNPANAQYQLWIVDPERDAKPVDGGVFDVSSSGEVIIPIQARLRVDAPQVFAITKEQPGGVVVSAGPLLVIAAAT